MRRTRNFFEIFCWTICVALTACASSNSSLDQPDKSAAGNSPTGSTANTDADSQRWALGVTRPVTGFTDRVRDTIKAEFREEKVEGEINRDLDEIWREKNGALADNPDFQRAESLRQARQFSEARDIYRNLSRDYPNASGIQRRLGDCYYNLLELAPAIDAYTLALKLNPENYFAMRGQGFAFLYYGHSLWDARDFAKAHAQYGNSLKVLQRCTRIYPADYEALYGRSMAAEGASRRLYQSAIALKKSGKDQQAAAAAKNCLEVIDEGIEAGKQRANKMPEEISSRNVVAGLFQRRALLCREFQGPSTQSLEQAVQAYAAILKIDPANPLAKQESDACESLLAQWREEDAKEEEE